MATHPAPQEVRRIADVRAPWCVTVYGDAESWLRGNHPTQEAATQIRAAVDALKDAGAPGEVVDAIRGRLSSVAMPATGDVAPVDHRVRSVAILATVGGAEVFALTTSPAPWVGVSDRFLVGPLLEAALSLVPPVLVLAVSENDVRLVDATAHPARPVDVTDLPRDLESTIALDLTGDRDTLAHLRTSEDPKTRLREYARAIDRVVEPVLRHAGAMLVIAAAEPLASIYRSTTRHGLVAPSDIVGNHDDDTPDELAELATPIVERHRKEVRERQLARLAETPARDLVLVDLDEIDDAARDGAIDTLFVDTGHRLPAPAEAFGRPITIDRVDELIRRALSTDATVVPIGSDNLSAPDRVAAVLRYAGAERTAARSL